MILSKYQEAIDNWVLTGRGNLVVNAVAGSGKSTQIRRNVTMVRGKRLLCAFNKTIAEENARKINDSSVTSKTIHSLGMAIVRDNVRPARVVLNDKKYFEIIRGVFDDKKLEGTFIKFFDLCRASLVGYSEDMYGLIEHYNLEGVTDQMIDMLPKVMRTGLIQAKLGIIDFTDMLWVPATLNLKPRETFDWVFCDELQDLSPAQAEVVASLVSPAGGRFVGVGDPRQAIMGFAGADSNSFYKLKERFEAVEMPLSVTYRCPLTAVKRAQRWVPHLEARPDAPEGLEKFVDEDELPDLVRDGDLVLCRLTAPLIQECIRMITRKIPARVRGRDIGVSLTAVVKRVQKANSGKYSPEGLHAWYMSELNRLERRENKENAVQAITDKYDGLRAIWEAYADDPDYSGDDFIATILSLFNDEGASVYLSTVHKAKGLEAERVFILKPSKLGVPLFKNQNDWQIEQEQNLAYVAYTRTMNETYICREQL